MKSKVAKKIFAGFLLFLINTLLTTSLLAQANNSITGFVFGFERKPLSNISVELKDDLNRIISKTETNGSGKYVFNRLSRGKYNIRISGGETNYQEEIKAVEISGNSKSGKGGSETFQQNFYLQKKPISTAVATFKNSVVFAQEVPQEAEKLYEEAVKNFNKKQPEIGFSQLKKALDIFPNYYLALEKLAAEYIQRQDYKNAFNIANKGVSVNSESYECWYVIGYSAYQLKSSDEAVKAFTKAVEILPNSINAFAMLGINLRQIGKYEEAEEALVKAKKLAESPVADIHWHLALLYTNNLKKYNEAITELELFLQAKPNFEEANKVKDLIKKQKAKTKT